MKNENHKRKMYYFCEGGCGAKLTEEEYEKHETKVCGADGCAHKGQSFVKREYCEDCAHSCDAEHSCC